MSNSVRRAIAALEKNDVAKALEILKDKTILLSEWGVEDVESRYNDRKENGDTFRLKLTEKRAIKILELIDHYHDANIGINWDVIDFHTDSVLGG